MKKILYIHHGGSQGGAPTSLKLLMMEINRKKYDPYLLCIGDEKGNRIFFEETRAKILFDPKIKAFHGSSVCTPNFREWRIGYRNIKGILPTVSETRRIIQRIKPDIIHLNSTCLCMVAMGIHCFYPEIPIVIHVREPVLDNIWGRIIRKVSRRFADFFIAIDKYDEKSIGADLDNSIVVYNSADLKKTKDKIQQNAYLRNKLKIPQNCIIFLYLARIIPANGCEEMIREFKFLNNKEAVLVIAGFSADETGYERKCRDLSDDVSNIYLLPFSMKPEKILASCDVLVSPFKEPHFSRSVIEAAAMGIPSIAGDVDALRELVVDKKTGVLFDTHDFQSLRNCYQFFIDHHEYVKIYGDEAQRFAYEHFDNVLNSQKVFEVYEQLLHLSS